MDHPFWESFEEDTPVHWDQIAAQYIGVRRTPCAHTEDFKGVPFSPFTDKNGTSCRGATASRRYYTPPGNGAMSFSTLSVPHEPERDLHRDDRRRTSRRTTARPSATTTTSSATRSRRRGT